MTTNVTTIKPELPNAQKQIRNLVSNYYDYQDLRIRTGNRLIMAVRMDMPESAKEEIKEKNKAKKKGEIKDNADDDKMLNLIVKEYEAMLEMVTLSGTKRKNIDADFFENYKLILNRTTFSLAEQYYEMIQYEDRMIEAVEELVECHPLWTNFLKDVKGCGPLMSGVILSYFNIYEARHVSSFWKYAGIDTVPVQKDDGTVERVGRTKAYTEMRPYTAADGTIKERNSLTYNPTVKTKLLGVLGSGFLKCKDYIKDDNGISLINPETGKRQSVPAKYARIYYDYKNRLENHPKHIDKTPAHRHNMAVRYMMQQFLRDLWVTWRTLEGLSVSLPYEVDKLGMQPHHYNEYHVEKARA